jgi:hypothetical protein
MESLLTSLETVPKWAYQWCNIFLVVAVLSVLTGFLGILFGGRKTNGMVIMYLISTVIQAATAMTLYWMCRSSLKNSE